MLVTPEGIPIKPDTFSRTSIFALRLIPVGLHGDPPT